MDHLHPGVFRPAELARLSKYVDGRGSAGPTGNEAESRRRYDEALADVFWALLNSNEFKLNH